MNYMLKDARERIERLAEDNILRQYRLGCNVDELAERYRVHTSRIRELLDRARKRERQRKGAR